MPNISPNTYKYDNVSLENGLDKLYEGNYVCQLLHIFASTAFFQIHMPLLDDLFY